MSLSELIFHNIKETNVRLTRIRHSPDPLDLSWVSQLHRPYDPTDRTCEDHLASSARCHSPLNHLRVQQQRKS